MIVAIDNQSFVGFFPSTTAHRRTNRNVCEFPHELSEILRLVHTIILTNVDICSHRETLDSFYPSKVSQIPLAEIGRQETSLVIAYRDHSYLWAVAH